MLRPVVVVIVMTACLVRACPLLGLPRAISEQQSLLKTLTLFVKFGYRHSIDCLYHFALYELMEAVQEYGADDAESLMKTLIEGKRIKDISDLPLDLSV